MNELQRQRLKFLAEHGEISPEDKPAGKSLLLKAMAVMIALQVFDIILSIHYYH